MSQSKMKATTFRSFMIFVVVLIIIAISGGLYMAQDWFRDYASGIKIASTTSNTVNATQTGSAASDKAGNITYSSQNFQTQVADDLTKYANVAGVTVSSVIQSQEPPTDTQSLDASGIQTKMMTITLSNPSNYANLIKFIKGIETNLPKMQITNMKISHNPEAKDSVTVDPITIEVYTR